MLKLEFKDRRQPGVWLVESVFTVGSDAGNHLILDDSSVSEKHATITLDGAHLYLSDLNSFKGTFVNGQKIADKYQLRPGDVIQVGDVELEITDPKLRSGGGTGEAKVKSDWTITALSGALKGKIIPLHGTMVLGRSEKCDLVINDEHMSRRHAELNLRDGVLRIVDLNSSNGTRVNNVKISEKVLKPGDKINFDQIVFLVAGPQGYVEAELDEDEEDATVFRMAPMPKARPQPPVNAQPAPSPARPSTASVDSQVTAAKPGGGLGLKITVVVLVIIAAAAAGAYFYLR
ncbi:MAG: FHA domain-containing protein [Gammaproteobacteria bacterium]|nr:MAG: FHA domain-containing protein [Gammaproteobacteria bacterium]